MPKNAAALLAALGALAAASAFYPIMTLGQEASPSAISAASPTATNDSPPSATVDLILPVPAAPAPERVSLLPTIGGEVRAMWVVRDSMTSPQKIRNAVALAKKYHFNTLFVQVRGRGDAFYDSHIEPRSEELRGQPESFDPLATAIEEGHRAGLQVHAWMNTFLVWHKPRHPYSARHVVNQHPEWLVQDRQGRTRLTECHDCEGAFLDPANPDVRQYTRRVFMDVVTHYAVDGIHFDYVRFPSNDYSFANYDLARFREWMSPVLSAAQVAATDARRAHNRLAWYYTFPTEWRQWRRGLVTQTVSAISVEAHRLRPGIVVSAAVFPSYRVASEDKGQAWREWLRDGMLDTACPMTYSRSTKLVAAQVRDAVANSSGRPIIAGVGAWQVSASSAIEKAQAYRSLGVAGINFFSYDGMTREGRTEHYLSRIADALFPTPAPAPNWRRTYATARRDSLHGG